MQALQFVRSNNSRNSFMCRSIVLFAFLSCLAVQTASAETVPAQPLHIVRVTPDGEDVPSGKQIVFEFDRAVAPLGRMERTAAEIPITISPPVTCSWRWLTATTLACQMGEKEALRDATRYSISVQPGITAEDGGALSEQATFQFVTVRPKVVSGYFVKWKSPAWPQLTVIFDQLVDRETVVKHVFFQVRDGERVAVTASSDQYYKDRGFAVEPVAELPANSEIALVIEPGVKSLAGPEASIEQRDISTLHTFPEFTFLGVRCVDLTGEPVEIDPVAGEDAEHPECVPLQEISLAFSAPTLKEAVKDVLSITPALGSSPGIDPWEGVYSYTQLESANQLDSEYTVTLPTGLKAKSRYDIRATDIKDEFSRPLTTPAQATFYTSHRRPKFTLLNPFSVLESGIGTDTPVVVTNLSRISLDFETQTSSGVTRHKKAELQPYAVQDVAYLLPLQVPTHLGASSGAIKGRISSEPANPDEYESRFFSEVTPFHMHAKFGHNSTLVWVTRFDTGLPVAHAKVSIYRDHFLTFADNQQELSVAETDENGIAMLKGTQELDPDQGVLDDSKLWSRTEIDYFMVKVDQGGEVGFLPLIYDFYQNPQGANDEYIYASLEKRYGHLKSWGTTPQGVYRAGDTIQYVLYVRDQNDRRLIPAPGQKYTLEIHDPMDNVVQTVPNITLSDFGAFAGEFTVAKSAPVGWYRFQLSASFTKQTWQPMQVLVSDFTPSPFKVRTDIGGTLFHEGDTLPVATEAVLHTGGPYGTAKTSINAQILRSVITPKDPAFSQFSFAIDGNDYATSFFDVQDMLDSQGKLATSIAIPDLKVAYGTISVESAVEDDRGKSVASRASVPYVGRDRYIGAFFDGWTIEARKPAVFQGIVIDERGVVAPGTVTKLLVEYREVTAARVKGAGNAFITEYQERWVPVTECQGVSGTQPVQCTFMPGSAGGYRLTASISDTKGRAHQSALELWATGIGDVVWNTEDGNRLNLVPDKSSYKVGETVKVLVQNPYPGAKALVTVERLGILNSWVQTLEGNTPVIEIPVVADYLPGVFLSVVVMSPRVDKPLGENQVDLGKPAFKMGYASISVKDEAKMLTVTAASDRKSYKPGDMVKVQLHAQAKSGERKPIQYAVAVLDEAVLDLIQSGKGYFDPYQSFYTLDVLDLVNFNSIRQLVGRIKFEKKGANPGGGGDGSKLKMRSNFKFVSYWNPALNADANGDATISFPVPDNLTGWRVLAIAMTKDDYMGLGDGQFVVNQSTEIRPALPNQVVAGDSFSAGFTVMNRTDKARMLSVEMKADGPLDGERTSAAKVDAVPFARNTLRLLLKTNAPGVVSFAVTAGDTSDKDGMRATVPVLPMAVQENAVVYGTSVEANAPTPILVPNEIGPLGGTLTLSASPTVIGNVQGAFAYMRDYPYECWEQRLTKGAMAAQYTALKKYLPETFIWEESGTLPQKTLNDVRNFQAPNGGMAYYLAEDIYVDPYLSAYTALVLNWLADAQYPAPVGVQDKLDAYLLTFLKENKAPDFYTDGMKQSVRAVILAALAPRNKVTKDDALRALPEAARMSVFGKALLLQALQQFPDTAAARKKVLTQIRASINESAGKLVVNENVESGYARILSSPLRSACAVLSAVTRVPEGEKADADNAFKLVRAITQSRGKNAHWENTQENMFCANALREYAKVFESETPNMRVTAKVDTQEIGSALVDSFAAQPAVFSRPLTTADAGKAMSADFERSGIGRIYYSAELSYTPKDLPANAANSGIEIRREYSVERQGVWELLKSPMEVRTGELVKVDLFIMLPAARNFVVVDDPLPGGLEPVNKDLATASVVAADKARPYAAQSTFYSLPDWQGYGVSRWSFYHQELRHDRAHFYSEYLAPGRYVLSYTAQAIAPGTFTVLPPRAEEMYDPDVFGRGVPEVLHVSLAE